MISPASSWTLRRPLSHKPATPILGPDGGSWITVPHVLGWRRGRDSNPRYGCPYAAFRVRCIQPLCHLSGVRKEPVKARFGRPLSNQAGQERQETDKA